MNTCKQLSDTILTPLEVTSLVCGLYLKGFTKPQILRQTIATLWLIPPYTSLEILPLCVDS